MAGRTRQLVPTTQILFGTDYPYRDIADNIQGLASCGLLSPAELLDVERSNAVRLFPRLAWRDRGWSTSCGRRSSRDARGRMTGRPERARVGHGASGRERPTHGVDPRRSPGTSTILLGRKDGGLREIHARLAVAPATMPVPAGRRDGRGRIRRPIIESAMTPNARRRPAPARAS